MAIMGRPPVKKVMIINSLRKDIVSGALPPGSRVPTRRELAAKKNATLKTVQQALESLERDGFVESTVGRGTFVTSKPPHLNDFALVFPGKTKEQGLLWEHLAVAARKVVKELGFKLSIYSGIDKYNPGKDYQRLLEDVQNDRLAGIIFSTALYLVSETDIADKPGIPRVFMSAPESFPQAGAIILEGKSFAKKAAGYFKNKKIKSVAVLNQPGQENELLVKELKKVGISCPYHLQPSVPLETPELGKSIMRLMFDKANTNRPGGLVIRDDNLFDEALAGILDAGISIPKDLQIITHSNFPWQEETPVPVTRLGYDMIEVLKLAMAQLENQRDGNKPMKIELPAVFENEIPQSTLDKKGDS